jgi:hypothetical protein
LGFSARVKAQKLNACFTVSSFVFDIRFRHNSKWVHDCRDVIIPGGKPMLRRGESHERGEYCNSLGFKESNTSRGQPNPEGVTKAAWNVAAKWIFESD